MGNDDRIAALLMTFPDPIGLGDHTFIPLKIEANGEHVVSECVIDPQQRLWSLFGQHR